MSAAAPLPILPEVVRCGPLALAAFEYWQRSSAARNSLWALGYRRDLTSQARHVLLSTACEGAEGLHDIATDSHPLTRRRAIEALPTLIPRITAFVEVRP